MTALIKPKLQPRTSYDDDFFDDMLGLFPDASGYAPKAGCCGKYLYENDSWDDAVEHDDSYYAPHAEHELLQKAFKEIKDFVPTGLPYVDFGAGGKASFLRNAICYIEALQSPVYVAVDFCKKALKEIQSLIPVFKNEFSIKTEELDLFLPTNKVLFKKGPALGVMNGLTVCNAYGLVKNGAPEENLVSLLKYLSQLCGHGWLLLTIDTNQNEAALRKAYDTPSLRRLYMSVLQRMADELPVEGFDPTAFVYDPEFKVDLQSWAHLLRATKTQDFKLGPYAIHIEQGQKIHFVNSFKLKADYFEDFCRKANLSIMKQWSHETGVMLYLLKDNLCTMSVSDEVAQAEVA